MWAYIPKLVGKVKVRELEIKKHIKPTIVLFLPQIATSVYTVLDKTMIGLLTGVEEEVAYYEQGQKIIKIVLTFITSLSTVMLPRVANLFQLQLLDEIKNYLKKSFRFALFLSFPMMFGLMAVSCNIVPWFFGAGYDRVIPNMSIIAPITVAISMSGIIGTQYLLPTGRQREYTISVLTGCAVNFFLNFLLIPHLLSIGAAVATVIAETSVTGVQVYFTRKDFKFGEIISNNKHYIISSLIMFIPTYLLARYLPSSIVNTFICVAVGGLIYVGLLFVLKDETLLEAVSKIKGKLVKK